MSQIVKLRRSAVPGKVPTNAQLELGELSINTTDGKLYFSKSGSLNASIEEVLTTNTQNTGSLNLSGSFNLIGTESITGSTKIIGSLSVTGATSLTSLVVSGADPVANVQVFVPSSSIYNSASFNTPNRVASGIRFNWNNEDWTIGAARGLTTDIDGLIFSKNGVRKYMIDEDGNASLSGSMDITGSLTISGTTTLGGSIIPSIPRGATLGTLERPFADIYVSSGSINMAGILGQPNTTLSNVSGNILISAGGIQLVGSGSFNAQTGSFQYISGSMKQVGDYTQVGNYSILGNKSITGSLNITGSLKLSGLSSGATTDNLLTYNTTTKTVGSITGLTASQVPTRYYGAFYDTTTQSGSANVSQSVKLNGTQHTNGVSVVSGGRITITNAGVYNLQFSTQLYRTGGGSTVDTYFWFRVNGTDVTNSNTVLSTQSNNGYTVASWNYVDVYNANDYVELFWMADGSNVQLQSITNPLGTPSIPSVILTLTQV